MKRTYTKFILSFTILLIATPCFSKAESAQDVPPPISPSQEVPVQPVQAENTQDVPSPPLAIAEPSSATSAAPVATIQQKPNEVTFPNIYNKSAFLPIFSTGAFLSYTSYWSLVDGDSSWQFPVANLVFLGSTHPQVRPEFTLGVAIGFFGDWFVNLQSSLGSRFYLRKMPSIQGSKLFTAPYIVAAGQWAVNISNAVDTAGNTYSVGIAHLGTQFGFGVEVRSREKGTLFIDARFLYQQNVAPVTPGIPQLGFGINFGATSF